jgi:hypothetical protein
MVGARYPHQVRAAQLWDRIGSFNTRKEIMAMEPALYLQSLTAGRFFLEQPPQ